MYLQVSLKAIFWLFGVLDSGAFEWTEWYRFACEIGKIKNMFGWLASPGISCCVTALAVATYQLFPFCESVIFGILAAEKKQAVCFVIVLHCMRLVLVSHNMNHHTFDAVLDPVRDMFSKDERRVPILSQLGRSRSTGLLPDQVTFQFEFDTSGSNYSAGRCRWTLFSSLWPLTCIND
jgi:hypothetical protein